MGIVEKVENGYVWIYDGNWGDQVSHHRYALTASNILGYGNPNYAITNHAYPQGVYESNETGHWQCCSICGTVTGVTPHRVPIPYQYDSKQHWKLCRFCGYRVASDHDIVQISLMEGYKCTTCPFRFGAGLIASHSETE